jgi:nucleotide-binding universal stress UspA family protein
MRVILVPVADRPECAVALHKAFSLGRELDASVIGFHVRPPGDTPARSPLAHKLPAASGIDAEWNALIRRRGRKNTEPGARALFARASQSAAYELHKSPRAKPGAMWLEKTGAPSGIIGLHGPVSDLLVVSRPDSKDGSIARLFMSAALMNSGRPVLVLPQKDCGAIGKRICIAWNQGAEAARAVAAALPLLQLAQHVAIASAGPESRPGPKSTQLVNYLKCWGVKSQRIATRGNDPAKELLGACRSSKSDVLVMGAYSRSRYSEMKYGEVTDFMLHRASIPVIMLHG